MKFLRKSAKPKTITCEDVVAAFGALVEKRPLASDVALLPFEPELIKAALVNVALRNGSVEAIDAAKTGFGLLSSFTGKASRIELTRDNENAIHDLIDREFDELERDFDSRLAFERSRPHA
jgi:hypothetical protein